MPWDKVKAKKILDLKDGEQWGKTLSFGLRYTLVIIGFVAVIFGIGYWHAIRTRPIIPVDFSSYIESGRTVRAKLNSSWLQIDKAGMSVTDEDGNLLKRIKVEDVPILSESLRPYGFTNNLIGYYGVGMNASSISAEAGAGVEFFRLWDIRAGIIGTNQAGYLSASYPVKRVLIFDLHNTAVVGATGYNYRGERQHSIGLRVRF